MKFSTQDLPHIRASLIMLASALALGSGIVYWSSALLDAARQSKTAADSEWAESRSRLERVKIEQQYLQDYYQRYQALVARDVIGPEKRLDWVEAIERIRRQQNVFGVKYKLEPQKILYSDVTPAGGGGFDLNLSNMILEFTLLHEGQLLDFLDALRTEANGMYLLDRCHLTRTASTQELKSTPNLRAECSLGWVTLKEKPVEAGK